MAVVLMGDQTLVETHESIESLIASHPACDVIAVDMPIGLPTDGALRECDQPARDYVGKRRNSVFPAPPQSVLDATTHKEASTLAKASSGKGISQQAYALRDKIAEVSPLAKSDKRIIEVHPEVSFCAMAGGNPLEFSKKSWNGQMQRLDLLRGQGVNLAGQLDLKAGTTPVDDVLDAAAAAWSAQRYWNDDAQPFPEGAHRGAVPAIWR